MEVNIPGEVVSFSASGSAVESFSLVTSVVLSVTADLEFVSFRSYKSFK